MPLTLKGFNAWISSEDSELKPYSVEESDDGKEVTCWIVSEAGKVLSYACSLPYIP